MSSYYDDDNYGSDQNRYGARPMRGETPDGGFAGRDSDSTYGRGSGYGIDDRYDYGNTGRSSRSDSGWDTTDLEPRGSRSTALNNRSGHNKPKTRPSAWDSLTSFLPSFNRSTTAQNGTVTLTGKVVSYQQRKRRHDFFHVMYDTLVNGAPLTFSPLCQVFTIELNDSDYTQIDSSSRRTVVVNMVGQVYDGTVRVQDSVSVKGQWTKHHTINASSVHNLSNGSTIATSHSLPAGAARGLSLFLLLGIIWTIIRLSSAAPASGGGLSAMLGQLLPNLILGAVVIWLFLGMLRGRRGRFFLGKILWIVVGIALFWLMLRLMPDLLTSLMTIAIILYAIWLMLKSAFK